jgi:polyisoprenoid-binding protein YceI
MDASIEVAAESGSEIDPGSVREVRVKVPVRMLRCGDRHMEAHLYSALKAPKPPQESYITAEFDHLPAVRPNSQPVEVSGKLRIASVERMVTMTVISDRLPDGTHHARGTVPITMTDFGITPPRPWGGILRTADRVLVQFEIFIVAPQ